MFWWTPDDSFLDINPQPLVFPPRDPVAQSRGDVTSSFLQNEIAKVVSADLESMAPNLVQLFRSSQRLVWKFDLSLLLQCHSSQCDLCIAIQCSASHLSHDGSSLRLQLEEINDMMRA